MYSYITISEYTHKPSPLLNTSPVWGKLSHTAGCSLVLVRLWGRLVVLVMRLGVFGIWMNMAWQQTLLGKSCHPLQAPSRESRALSCQQWEWGGGSPAPRSSTLLSSALQLAG